MYFVFTEIDSGLGNSFYVTRKESQEQGENAEKQRLKALKSLEIDMVDDEDDDDDDVAKVIVIDRPGFLGYNKLSGLGSELITAPRAYSSGLIRKKNVELSRKDKKIETIASEEERI